MAKESLLPQQQSQKSNTSMLGANRGGTANYSRYIRSNPNGDTQSTQRGGNGLSGYGDNVNIGYPGGATGRNVGSFFSMPALSYSSPYRMMGSNFSDYLSSYMDSMGGLMPLWGRPGSDTMNRATKKEEPTPPTPTTFSGNEMLGRINSKLNRGLSQDEIEQAVGLLGGRREGLTSADEDTVLNAIKQYKPELLLGGI